MKRYIEKNINYGPLVQEAPLPGLGGIVIIPAYNEPDFAVVLESLVSCDPALVPMEIILLFNHAVNTEPSIKQINEECFDRAKLLASLLNKSELLIHPVLVNDFPAKHAGAGLARKTAMDEAVRRLHAAGNENGFIVSLDADCCVSTNFLREISQAYQRNKRLNATIHRFEHPLDSSTMCSYELHLRYFRQALKFTGFPFAYHTIGSCFSVKSSVYAAQGGMNKRQGGEDFYFLHKVFPLGNIEELNQLTVYPSDRLSDRVPFGTGPALRKIEEEGSFDTYCPESFIELKRFFALVENFYDGQVPGEDFYGSIPLGIQQFMSFEETESLLKELLNNSASKKAFIGRFYRNFDGFRVVKFLNHYHQTHARLKAEDAAAQFLQLLQDVQNQTTDLLTHYRLLDGK